MIRAIATDLDGTFLGADGEPSARNVEAVMQAAQLGVRTIFATGRPYRWLRVLEPLASADPLVLASNGAVRYDLHRRDVISADLLDAEAALAVVADIRAAHPEMFLALELLEGYAADEDFPVKEDREHQLVECTVEQALEQKSPVKLLVLSADHHVDDLAREVMPVVGDRMTVTWSFVGDAGLLEISRAGVNKGSGLATLLQEMSVDPGQVAAFGDMPNDMPMLDLVGRPYRMQHCHVLLEEKGYPVAGPHDDSGVGRRIEELLGLDVPS